MYKRIVVFIVALFFVLAPVASADHFKDVSGFSDEIHFLTDRQIIAGYPDGTYKPKQSVSRLHAVQMLIRDIDDFTSTVKDPGLTDITPESKGYYEIARAVELGIINGKVAKDGTRYFDPNGKLTRGELAVILTETYDLSSTGEEANYFRDVKATSVFYSYVSILVNERITLGYGDGTFGLIDPVSREHFAAFLARVLDETFRPAEGVDVLPPEPEPEPEPEPKPPAVDYSYVKSAASKEVGTWAFESSNTSITIREAATGQVVYSYGRYNPVTPASNQKLMTGAAALELLGENYRFTTSLWTNSSIKSGTLGGHIYLKGQGDPTLLKSDLEYLARQLKAKGVTKINGNVVGDSSWYDSSRYADKMQPEDEPYYYSAQTMALTLAPNKDYDAGSVIVAASPTSSGSKPKITLEPYTSVMTISNSAKTVSSGSANTLKITRNLGTNTIVITGNIPVGASTKKEWISVVNPAGYALDVFKKALQAEGISFGSGYGQLISSTVPSSATKVAETKSDTLKSLMPVYMKLSNNSMAEHFTKQIGAVKKGTGSWPAGIQAVKEYGKSIGLTMDHWTLIDGSGMSYRNRLTSDQVSLLLLKVRKEPWYPTFEYSLPVAGNSDRLIGGTLRYRLTGSATRGRVLAKTGSLDHVKSLSGYTLTGENEELIFSILTDQNPTGMIPHIDRLVTAISAAKR